jgi:pseudomonalisin
MDSERNSAVACGAAGVFILTVGLVLLMMESAAAQVVATSTVVLVGNHPAESANLLPVGHADPAARLNLDVTLALCNRSQLDQLLRDQQNPASPQYHRWLTPAQFAARFGPSRQDLDAVAQWLTAQGFTVTAPSLARPSVRFTGTVADAEHAFATHIMKFGDGTSYSNITDPLIPARFSGVISAIGGLDNFLHSFALYQSSPGAPMASPAVIAVPPMLLDAGPALPSPAGGPVTVSPDVTIDGTTAFGPSDFRSFYNEDPLISGGITGAGGDCVAIVGDSDYTPGAVSLFNSTFSLPASSITTVLTDSTNPGMNGDQDEALLDLEWSHAVAPGAATRFYLGDNSNSSSNGAIVDSIQAAVNDNLCGVISVSFSLCGGSAAFFTGVVSPIYAQMAAQGQSILISSGDQGAAGLVFATSPPRCVFGTSRNINELGGDANVTQVGGTGFTPNYDPSGNNVGHVAESVWNDSVAHPGGGSTGGGASIYYSKPSYQMGPGVPSDGMRDVPDIALIASPYSPGVFWGSVSAGMPAIRCCIGGTSLSAPAWAGIAKLIAQLQGSRPGPLNPRIYALANAGAATAGFRDVTTGNNDFNGVTGFVAGPGFDLATGWGTVDIATFANDYVVPPSPEISSIPSIIEVGSSFGIDGSFFGPGAMVNFFVATASGAVNAGPLTPSALSPTHLTVPVPATVPLGQGFVTVQVVNNSDLGFKASNPASALLQGSAAAGIPSLTSINGVGLASTSSDPHYATNNVETVITRGNSVTLGGTGFDAANGVAVDVFCACTGGRIPPIFIDPGPGLTSTSFNFMLPLSVNTGPASLIVSNKGADASYSKSSNAVSVPVGAAITVSAVTQLGSTITVDGAGFSTLTVINLFNKQGASVVNLGGFAGGVPNIPLTLVNSTRFTFTKPSGAVAGPAYVQALNPPFVPFTSSGTGPGGAFTLF